MLIFISGALIYGFIEIAWRGRTHWTMLICGGACFLSIYYLSALPIPLVGRCAASAAAITALEFLTGCIVNLRLGWAVWDYSDMRGNILGQVCPQFSLCWLALSVPGVLICERLHMLI